jgi:hypothetical protein
MFNMAFGRSLLGFSVLLLTPATVFAQVQGKVTDRDGKPLSGICVWSGTAKTESDKAGNFSLTQGKVIGLSKPGYRPITKLREEIAADPVIVMDSPREVWRAPKCSTQADLSARSDPPRAVSGAHMRFMLPAGARVQRVSDADYWQNVVCTDGGCLEHGWGPLRSSGTRVSDVWVAFFSNVRQMTEREMYGVPHNVVLGEEYRGVGTDGTYFRWAGVLNESVGYDHATKASAAFFDKIIDTLCWF